LSKEGLREIVWVKNADFDAGTPHPTALARVRPQLRPRENGMMFDREKEETRGWLSLSRFRPSRWVRGVFGDPQARIMVLEREQRKQLAAFAVKSTGHFTTARRGASEISPAASALGKNDPLRLE
jgi:hypothetical protein